MQVTAKSKQGDTKMALTSDEQWNIEAKDHQHAMQHFSDSTHHHHYVVSKSSSSSSSSKGRSVVCNCKPVIAKRRCRASKKSPVILLNANSSNFRALVQQFTGCPTTPWSPGVPFKGPITLNFQRGIREMQIHHNNRSSATTWPTSYQDDHHNNNNNNQVLHHVRRFHQNHHQHQQIQSQVSADISDDFDDGLHDQEQGINVDDDDYCMIMEKDCSFGVCSPSSSGRRQVSDDLIDDHFDGLMDDFSLHDLIDMNNAFSNDLGYFL